MDPDLYATPTAMLARVREVKASQAAAEVELLELAVGWADAHPDPHEVPPPDPPFSIADLDRFAPVDPEEDPEHDPLVPGMAWDAGAPFAAAIGTSTAAGEALVRDALTLRHKLPQVWARVLDGHVAVWRARRIAQTVFGQPADVAAHLDETIAPIAGRVGAVTLDRLLDEAMLRLYPEQRELEQLEALDARHATLHQERINHTGVVDMTLRGDWKDLSDFDATLSEVAAVLAALDQAEQRVPESLDVRRSRAVGVLADPDYAAALLAERAAGPDPGQPAAKPARPRRKRMELVVHLSEAAVKGMDPVGRNATTGRAVLEQQIRDWCGRTDTHLSVTQVVDLTDHVRVDRYEVGDRLAGRVDLRHPSCVFPWCTRPARRCDKDHVIPHAEGGATCDCNLAPLCRRHHRLKTKAGWRYTTVEPGVWVWSDPHGQQFLRNQSGTLDVTPPDRPVTTPTGQIWSGCRHGPPG